MVDRITIKIFAQKPGIPSEHLYVIFFSSRRRHTECSRDWSSDVCSSDLSPFGADGYPAIDQQTGKVFQAAGNPNGDGTYNLLLNIGTPDVNGNLPFLDAPAAATTGWSPAKIGRASCRERV